MIVLSGDTDGEGDAQKNTLVENLKRIADIVVKEDVTINLEALNSLVDHKGYYVDTSGLGFDILKVWAALILDCSTMFITCRLWKET